jgi:hypothetical protein
MSHFFDGDVKLLVVNEEKLKYVSVKELEVGQKLKTVSSSTTLLEIKEEEKECYLIKPCSLHIFPTSCIYRFRRNEKQHAFMDLLAIHWLQDVHLIIWYCPLVSPFKLFSDRR